MKWIRKYWLQIVVLVLGLVLLLFFIDRANTSEWTSLKLRDATMVDVMWLFLVHAVLLGIYKRW